MRTRIGIGYWGGKCEPQMRPGKGLMDVLLNAVDSAHNTSGYGKRRCLFLNLLRYLEMSLRDISLDIVLD